MAALRLGFAVAPPAVVEQLERVVLPYHLAVPTQLAGIEALAFDAEMRSRVDAVVAERHRLASALRRLPGLTVYPSGANFVLVRADSGGHALSAAARRPGRLGARLLPRPPARGLPAVTVGTPAEDDQLLAALRDCSRRRHDRTAGLGGEQHRATRETRVDLMLVGVSRRRSRPSGQRASRSSTTCSSSSASTPGSTSRSTRSGTSTSTCTTPSRTSGSRSGRRCGRRSATRLGSAVSRRRSSPSTRRWCRSPSTCPDARSLLPTRSTRSSSGSAPSTRSSVRSSGGRSPSRPASRCTSSRSPGATGITSSRRRSRGSPGRCATRARGSRGPRSPRRRAP